MVVGRPQAWRTMRHGFAVGGRLFFVRCACRMLFGAVVRQLRFLSAVFFVFVFVFFIRGLRTIPLAAMSSGLHRIHTYMYIYK